MLTCSAASAVFLRVRPQSSAAPAWRAPPLCGRLSRLAERDWGSGLKSAPALAPGRRRMPGRSYGPRPVSCFSLACGPACCGRPRPLAPPPSQQSFGPSSAPSLLQPPRPFSQHPGRAGRLRHRQQLVAHGLLRCLVASASRWSGA